MKKIAAVTVLGFLLSFYAVYAHQSVVVIPLSTCPSELESCDGTCVDTQNNPNHCGSCNTQCDTLQPLNSPGICTSGICLKASGAECNSHSECITQECYSGICGKVGNYVFLSSTTHTGDMGGLDGADAICLDLARNNGLRGLWRAWLSDTDLSPSNRFIKSDHPYYLLDHTMIASSWADLTDGNLDQRINLTETNERIVTNYSWSVPVWTGTDIDGGVLMGGGNCTDWTDGSSTFEATTGYVDFNNGEWTRSSFPQICLNEVRIYCFQQ